MEQNTSTLWDMIGNLVSSGQTLPQYLTGNTIGI
jgi:hypothetical protein